MKDNQAFYLILTCISSVLLLVIVNTITINQLVNQNQDKKQTLVDFNEMLDFYVSTTSNALSSAVKKRPAYKELYRANDQLRKIIQPIITSIDEEYKALHTQEHTCFLLNRASLDKVIIEDSKSVVPEIYQLIAEIKEKRNLGIKPDEIKELYEGINSSLTTLESLQFTLPISQIAYKNQLLEIKNCLLKINSKITRYLTGKVGFPCFGGSIFRAASSPQTSVIQVGEEFETDLFISQIPPFEPQLIEATVNGIPHEVKDGVVQFKEKPVTRGRHQYEVKFQLKNRFTGKTNSFRKTFSYLVR